MRLVERLLRVCSRQYCSTYLRRSVAYCLRKMLLQFDHMLFEMNSQNGVESPRVKVRIVVDACRLRHNSKLALHSKAASSHISKIHQISASILVGEPSPSSEQRCICGSMRKFSPRTYATLPPGALSRHRSRALLEIGLRGITGRACTCTHASHSKCRTTVLECWNALNLEAFVVDVVVAGSIYYVGTHSKKDANVDEYESAQALGV